MVSGTYSQHLFNFVFYQADLFLVFILPADVLILAVEAGVVIVVFHVFWLVCESTLLLSGIDIQIKFIFPIMLFAAQESLTST